MEHQKTYIRPLRLRNSERSLLDQTFEQAPAFMAVTSGPRHVFLKVNRNFAKLLQCPEDVAGRPLAEAAPSLKAQGFGEFLDETYLSARPYFGTEVPLSLPDGAGGTRELHVDFACEPLFDSGGQIQGILLQGFDVSVKVQSRAANDALRKETERKLEEAVHVRDEFISVASHELRTPVTALKLQTDLSARKIRKNISGSLEPETVLKLLDGTNRQLDQLTRLIDDMLDVARLATGRLKLDLQPVNLAAVARDAFDGFATQFHLARVEARFEALATPLVRADVFRLEQVLTNLLSNALKYGNAKPVLVEVDETGDIAILRVIDEGMGIPEHAQGIVFERFERAISDRNVSGLGLGLYIGRQIVESHGGQIEVESKVGQGSRFSVMLPKVS